MSKYYKTSGCTHADVKKVFKVNAKAVLWGGAKEELLTRPGWALVISAVGFTEFSQNPLTANEGAHDLLPKELFAWSAPACVGITWPDRGVPFLNKNWWADLAGSLREVEGDIAVCCMGGHGRTGTMLAIFASLFGKVPKSACPVDWVRSRYCDCAVESEEQMRYVERITGREVFAEVHTGATGSAWAAPALIPAGASIPYKAGSAPAGKNPTASGFKAGTQNDGIVRGDNPHDEDMLDAWFSAPGDVITTVNSAGSQEHLVPVWDKGGDHCGWRTATEKELVEG